MKTLYVVLGIISISFFSCGSSKSTATDAEVKALTDLVNKRNFRIESQWAYPQATMAMQQTARLLGPGNNASSVNLIGNDNFLTISNDSINSYLPYFGERQMGAAYGGGDSTIQFKGTVENYKVVENKNDGYNISFNAKSNSESFNVNIALFPNLKADITLNGSSRSSIRYSGTVKSVEK